MQKIHEAYMGGSFATKIAINTRFAVPLSVNTDFVILFYPAFKSSLFSHPGDALWS